MFIIFKSQTPDRAKEGRCKRSSRSSTRSLTAWLAALYTNEQLFEKDHRQAYISTWTVRLMNSAREVWAQPAMDGSRCMHNRICKSLGDNDVLFKRETWPLLSAATFPCLSSKLSSQRLRKSDNSRRTCMSQQPFARPKEDLSLLWWTQEETRSF